MHSYMVELTHIVTKTASKEMWDIKDNYRILPFLPNWDGVQFFFSQIYIGSLVIFLTNRTDQKWYLGFQG